MEDSLLKLAKLILNDNYFEFKTFIAEYNSDIKTFKNKYKILLLKWIDKEDFDLIQDYLSPEYLFEIFANNLNRVSSEKSEMEVI